MPRRSTAPLTCCVRRSLACAAMVSACTEAHDLDAPITGMDASVPSAEAGTMDAQAPLDTGHEAAIDAFVELDAAWALCRVPSREACGIGDKRAVVGATLTCSGDKPELCHHINSFPAPDAG